MNDDDPSQISIDVAQLTEIGQYHLPELANRHLDAANKLAEVEYLRPQLFLTPASGESGVQSVIYPKWLELYSTVQTVLKNTVDTLTDTGDGCVEAADAFYDQDLTNAEKLEVNDLLDIYANGDSEGSEQGAGDPPPHPGAPPDPNPVPTEQELYTSDDGAGVDDSDLIS